MGMGVATAGNDKETLERKTTTADSQDQPEMLGKTMADSSKIELMSFRKWGRASEEAAARGCGGGRGAMAAEGRGPERHGARGARTAGRPVSPAPEQPLRPGGLRAADSGPGARPGA